MTRLLECTDGAEFGDILFWDAHGGTVQASTSQKRSGNYAYRLTDGGSFMTKNFPAALTEVYIRFGVYNPTGQEWMCRFLDAISTIQVYVLFNKITGMMNFYRGDGTFLGASTYPLLPAQWYLVEIHVLVDNATGKFEAHVDGASDFTYTGDTQMSGISTAAGFQIMGNGNDYVYFDDFGANNTAGLTDKTWVGEGRIELLTPNGNGDVSDWTGSDGDQIDNYKMVETVPAGLTYITDATLGHQDMVNVKSMTTGKKINRVWAECRARGMDGSGESIEIGVQDGATLSLSAARPLGTTYGRVIGDDLTTSPNTGVVWTELGVDTAQFAVETA